MTSPARRTTTVSPTRTSLRAISSSLCRVALETTTPPTVTGLSLARGVSAPVRPTLISIASTTVIARSAGNLCATAHRGEREMNPSRLLQRKIVDLVDDAVDVVAERRALSLDDAVACEHLGGRMADLGQRIGRQAEAAHGFDGAELRRSERLADLAPGVSEEGERPACGDARVELAQRAGGEVARIGVDRLSRLRLAGVERGEIGMAHVDLAARLENPWRAFEPVRDRLHRAHVGGHVLALVAVAARRRPHEFAVLVAQIAGEPVDLRLGDEGKRRAVAQTQKAPHPGAELLHFLIGEDVAERQHRDRVANLGEFL